mmetsp:Transcript_52917/g.123373  ORF Transcript_52917/g.123373 Transcript_52917/m.123373 type:complete len:216 (+) Transcript_52917:211-858(+)
MSMSVAAIVFELPPVHGAVGEHNLPVAISQTVAVITSVIDQPQPPLQHLRDVRPACAMSLSSQRKLTFIDHSVRKAHLPSKLAKPEVEIPLKAQAILLPKRAPTAVRHSTSRTGSAVARAVRIPDLCILVGTTVLQVRSVQAVGLSCVVLWSSARSLMWPNPTFVLQHRKMFVHCHGVPLICKNQISRLLNVTGSSRKLPLVPRNRPRSVLLHPF